MLCKGSAAICLLSEHMTVVRQRIDTNVPRKRKGGTSGHDKVRPSPFLKIPAETYI
jgi:protein pelota